MSASDTETRTVTLVDIPLVRRLSEEDVVLDSEVGLTRDLYWPHSTLLSSILSTQRGVHTLVTRSAKHNAVGQFRLKGDDLNAHIVYIAPHLEAEVEDTVWLHILDAMAREAGKHGAHTLIGEVDEDHSLFETMRTANFSIYARQCVWRREWDENTVFAELVELHEKVDADIPGIYALLCMTVPSLIQQITPLPNDTQGFIYRKGERIEGYIAISAGKYGVYLTPYLHPDIMEEAAAIIETTLHHIQDKYNVPAYVCVRRYQGWLECALEDLAFEPGTGQAVMVKHITAGVRHAAFQPVRHVLEAKHSPVPPPTKHTHRPY
jgi:hypothetical protein